MAKKSKTEERENVSLLLTAPNHLDIGKKIKLEDQI